MILKTFSIYDSKAEAFLSPFFSHTAGLALRNFEEAANTEGHAFKKHPGDYSLFELGEFDDVTGQIIMHSTPINLGLALTVVHDEVGGSQLPMLPTPQRTMENN